MDNPLDQAWHEINALGGIVRYLGGYDQGFCDAIGKALEIIEKLGGDDPLKRKANAAES